MSAANPPDEYSRNKQPLTNRDLVKQKLKEWRESLQQRSINAEHMKLALKASVRGQDHVIDDFVDFIRLQWAQNGRQRPIAIAMFLGPPATGKSILARGIARYLYKKADSLLTFACEGQVHPEDSLKLVGSSKVWQGSECGTLTGPLIDDPKRVILFDEIERAHRNYPNTLLNAMEFGFLKDSNLNRDAFLNESIMIFTSNAERDRIDEIARMHDYDSDRMRDKAFDVLEKSGKFDGAFLSRIDRFYVFKPLSVDALIEIGELEIVEVARKYEMQIHWIHPDVMLDLVKQVVDAKYPARDLRTLTARILGSRLLKARDDGHSTVDLVINDQGQCEAVPAT